MYKKCTLIIGLTSNEGIFMKKELAITSSQLKIKIHSNKSKYQYVDWIE